MIMDRKCSVSYTHLDVYKRQVILLLIKVGFPVVLCPYIAVPFIAAPIIPKFYKKDGMGLFEHRKKISEMKKATILSLSLIHI